MPRPMIPELSVVIPAYNEAARLPPTLIGSAATCGPRGVPFEIVVVDDGSSDGTAAVAEREGAPAATVVRVEPNRGRATRCGSACSGREARFA